MKQFLPLLCCAIACAQTAPQATPQAHPDLTKIPDSQEICKIDGKPFTMAEYRAFVSVLDPANQARAAVDPGAVVEQLALMHKLAALATEQKLDEQSPTKEQLEFQRISLLMQVEIAHMINAPVVHQEDLEAFYKNNKEFFKQVKLQAIKIAFGSGSKPMSEDDAKAKATRLVAAIRGGADFVKLVKENCDDDALKGRDGEFQTVTPKDNIPNEFRAVVFKLKESEVTDPIRQADGNFYILRAEEVKYKPLSEVQGDVYNQLKNQMGQDEMKKIKNGLNLQFDNPAFPAPVKK